MGDSMISISASAFEFSELWKLADIAQDLKEKHIGVELFADAMGFGETHYIKELFPDVELGMHCPAKDINLLAKEGSLPYRYTFARMEGVLESCQKLGCRYMVLHTNVTALPLTGDLQMLQEIGIERIGKVAEIAEKYGVTIWVENVGTIYRKTLLYTYDAFLNLFSQLPQVGALIDVGHAHINQWNIPELIHTLGTRLKGMHLHDNFGGRDVHIRMGSGTVDFEGIKEAVSQLEESPNLIVEYLMPSCDNVDAVLADCNMLKDWR